MLQGLFILMFLLQSDVIYHNHEDWARKSIECFEISSKNSVPTAVSQPTGSVSQDVYADASEGSTHHRQDVSKSQSLWVLFTHSLNVSTCSRSCTCFSSYK